MTHRGRFDGRRILVTGATGMAEAAALALAAEGASLHVLSRTADHARDLADRVTADGGRATWTAADLTQEADVEAGFAAGLEQLGGGLDAVYHVAGISARRYGDGRLHEMTLDGWRAAIDTNATSAFLVARAAVRVLLRAERDARGHRGTILLMGSRLATSPAPRYFATHGYAASKGAIEAFARSVAAAYAPEGIRVNVIAPSLTATPMSERAQHDADILGYMHGKHPLAGEPLRIDDVTGTALFLLSDDARMVTGQVIHVDAGWGLADP